MTVEKMFHELLGLGLNWEVVESRFDKVSGTVFLEIRETPRLWDSVRCPKSDGGKATCYDHTEVLTWRHLNVFEHRCEITCRLPRGKCSDCGHIFRVSPPWEGLSSHFTKAFEAYALLLMREMPMRKVAQVVGETDTRLWRMLFRHVDRAYAEADFSTTCWVAVDEMHARKGHKYLTVFADLATRRVLFATKGKDKSTWDRFIAAFQAHNGHRHSITQASMDMSKAYQAGVARHCRNAQVVFDKFHVIQHANKAVDQVKRAEIRLGIKGAWTALKDTQWLWRKNPQNLNAEEQERLAELQSQNLHTAQAYQMRLLLQDIYKSATPSEAELRLKTWCQWIHQVAQLHPTTLYRSMVNLAKLVETHLKGILAHWKSGLTNAFMEGLNSVFSATKRKARGYKSTSYMIAMLYFTAGKLKIPQP